MRISLCVITALAICLPAPLAAQEYSLSRLDSLCGNREPIIDSAFGANPDLTVLARQGALSPDGNTVAYHYERMWPPFLSGVILDGKNPGTQAVYFENYGGRAGRETASGF